MTVRWKPLLILSGLFLVVAVVGFVAIAATLGPKGSAEFVRVARAERKAGQYDKALIHFQKALQVDPRNPAIHEELAAMFGEWAGRAPADQRPKLGSQRLTSLAEAAKFGKNAREPRRQLLLYAMAADESTMGVHWARELLTLEPKNPDAQYVLASEALEARTPVMPEVKQRLADLEAAKAPAVRLAWIKARAAQVTADAVAREKALQAARSLSLSPTTDPVDRSALLRLKALDVETTESADLLGARVDSLLVEARSLAAADAAPNRVMKISGVLQAVQKSLVERAARSDVAARPATTKLVEAVEVDLEAIFTRSLAAASQSDLSVYLRYADHLRGRGERSRCLQVVDEALKTKLARVVTNQDTVMGLHAVAVESALGDLKDAARFDKSAPHIAAMIASKNARFQGIGHLFQGAIELEKSGVTGAQTRESDAKPDAVAVQTKVRSSALNHLKIAAAQLPNVVEAQARYGVALILSQEQGLGRQYLQNALRQGGTDPQYQIWAAWSVVQAGYPEEAEPIVNQLQGEIAAGRLSRDLEGMLHLLSGEILQAGKTPASLQKALAAYNRSYPGQEPPPAVQLRMAQIDVQLGRPDEALKRIERLRATGKGGTAAEHLAVLTLMETGKKDEAAKVLAGARAAHPDSDELVGLESSVLVRDGKAREAETVLAAFLERHPGNLGLTLNRAGILSDLLDDAKAARAVLVKAADLSDNSAPLVQLALLDLKQKDFPAVAATIAKIRGRWKEAAAADVLDAQLALEQGRLKDASGFFDAALKKDPGNKVVQYYKAQLDNRMGDSKGAANSLEEIARLNSSKELENGISVAAAARAALANLSLQKGDVDAAIRRFEGLRAGGLSRSDRWQLAGAYAAKGQWPDARREIATILNDTKNPPSNDERVRAANYYRENGEEPAGVAQLDYVLSLDPTQPAAVATRAYVLAEAKKTAEAAALVRKAIELSTKEKPPAVFFLMLAALENILPPADTAATRATAALDQGLQARGNTVDLVQAKYRLLLGTKGPKDARAFVEEIAPTDETGTLRRLLAAVYREQNDDASAEKTLQALMVQNPKDAEVAAELVRTIARQAERAGERDDRNQERADNDRAAALVRDFRVKFPDNIVFLQEDCELAFRKRDLARATAITKEIDQLAKSSPVGPLLRARMFELQGQTREEAEAYTEALARNGNQPDVRVLLGQACLKLGQPGEALDQARRVLDLDAGRVDAVLLEARALNEPSGSAEQTQSRRATAVAHLSKAIKARPNLPALRHQLAEIQAASNQMDVAEATLREAIQVVPEDSAGLARLVELLARPDATGSPAPAKLAEARKLADGVAARDTKGGLLLALAVGFHKADQLDQALAFAEKAASRLDSAVLHLNYGDILLSKAERTAETELAKGYFRRAVDQYDQALKSQANSVEAVNNKAWILHSYLGESRQALELSNALIKRVDPATLPGEFFDTLGAIQESLGQKDEAEMSYNKGLRKAPDHPVLNYHMGKLIMTDVRRAGRAKTYLEKAFAGRNRLTPTMAAEVTALMSKVSAN